MKYYLIAGEASGDLHGSNLMKCLKELDPNAEFRYWGGDLMKVQGGTLVSHYKQRAFMGLWEVITHLRSITAFLDSATKDIQAWKPDALILIDNPGFNLRIAAKLKQHKFPIHYYIAPKAWAWNEKRVKQIRENIDHLYCILPFEPDFYSKHNIHTQYVGNPSVESVMSFKKDEKWLQKNGIEKPVIALLPGSRISEIERILPLMLQIPDRFPEFQFVIAAAPDFDTEWYQQFKGINKVFIAKGETYHILSHAKAALVASGTATLETALFNVPQVVCYKVAWLTYNIGKMLVKLHWFGLVNLILNKGLLTELLQEQFTPKTLASELKKALEGPRRDEILEGYKNLKQVLGNSSASTSVAIAVFNQTAPS